MNLYDLHTNPKSLYGYEDRWKLPEIAYNMAVKNSSVRNPKLERVIVQNLKWAYLYAYYILNDPKSRKKQRWQEAEPYIIQDPQWAYRYARSFLGGRWADIGKPEAEDYIMQNPYYAYNYARNILNDPVRSKKQRWREAEPFIMQDPESAYLYALDIIGGEWPEAEPYIMQDPESAYVYALDILKRRWADIGKSEAEDYIKRDEHWWIKYKRHFRIRS